MWYTTRKQTQRQIKRLLPRKLFGARKAEKPSSHRLGECANTPSRNIHDLKTQLKATNPRVRCWFSGQHCSLTWPHFRAARPRRPRSPWSQGRQAGPGAAGHTRGRRAQPPPPAALSPASCPLLPVTQAAVEAARSPAQGLSEALSPQPVPTARTHLPALPDGCPGPFHIEGRASSAPRPGRQAGRQGHRPRTAQNRPRTLPERLRSAPGPPSDRSRTAPGTLPEHSRTAPNRPQTAPGPPQARPGQAWRTGSGAVNGPWEPARPAEPCRAPRACSAWHRASWTSRWPPVWPLRGISRSLAKPVFSDISPLPLVVTLGFSSPSGCDPLGWEADFSAAFPRGSWQALAGLTLERKHESPVGSSASGFAAEQNWCPFDSLVERKHFMHSKKQIVPVHPSASRACQA